MYKPHVCDLTVDENACVHKTQKRAIWAGNRVNCSFTEVSKSHRAPVTSQERGRVLALDWIVRITVDSMHEEATMDIEER